MEQKYLELLKIDATLRSEADAMLEETGLGRLIYDAGYHPVGSYVMKLMTWRDLDFERTFDEPSWAEHWQFGDVLARTGLIWKFSCADAYRDRRNPGEKGFYWGLQFDYPIGGSVWKVDLWSARPEEFETGSPKRSLWTSLLTDQLRAYILEIKNSVYMLPEYRKNLLSVHIYDAVLEHGIRGLDEFLSWWRRTYGEKEKSNG
jgi:hypothetical protein